MGLGEELGVLLGLKDHYEKYRVSVNEYVKFREQGFISVRPTQDVPTSMMGDDNGMMTPTPHAQKEDD
jgi:hypothetical protein